MTNTAAAVSFTCWDFREAVVTSTFRSSSRLRSVVSGEAADALQQTSNAMAATGIWKRRFTKGNARFAMIILST